MEIESSETLGKQPTRKVRKVFLFLDKNDTLKTLETLFKWTPLKCAFI